MSAEPKIVNFTPGPERLRSRTVGHLDPRPRLPGFEFQIDHYIARCCVMLDKVAYLTRSVSTLMKSRYLRDYCEG